MRCYNCGCQLSEHDFCTSCGVDVGQYKKIMFISNRFYNSGLDKARVRDLTGAIIDLRQSLKFNKHNIAARNLLGLVYFETGEVVAALSEWVISMNLRPQKNIADDYISMIQTNQTQLDTINQTIKKYNQALLYCHQDSLDLAIIQLKKVLSLNPNFVRAHQLLALLYINKEDWERAKRELNKCIAIDVNNTTTMRYMQEVESMLIPEEGSAKQTSKKKAEKEDVVRYQIGTETIIQPSHTKEQGSFGILFNIIIGVAIGVAIAYFLILPGKISNQNASENEQITALMEQMDEKTATIGELEQQLGELSNEKAALSEQLQGYVGTDGSLQASDALMAATQAYLEGIENGDSLSDESLSLVEKYLDMLDAETLAGTSSEAFQNLYATLIQEVGPSLAASNYAIGYDAYKKDMYDEAISYLEKAYRYNSDDEEALFYLARAYHKNGNTDRATELYDEVVQRFPDTEKANDAQNLIAEIINEDN